MKRALIYFFALAAIISFSSCNQKPGNPTIKKIKKRQPVNYANYIIEIITYKTKKSVDRQAYTRLDSIVQKLYTEKQLGYISKESGVDQQGNWLVVVSWDNEAHANAANLALPKSKLYPGIQKLVDTATLQQKRFMVKDDHSSSLKDQKPYVIEVATFKEKSKIVRDTFDKRDQQVEADYISRQNGYITRRIGIAPNGERLMLIFWKTLADADNGMKAFLKDQSVADYAKMIDWKTVDMKRFEAVN